jgi:hypothetical protein
MFVPMKRIEDCYRKKSNDKHDWKRNAYPNGLFRSLRHRQNNMTFSKDGANTKLLSFQPRRTPYLTNLTNLNPQIKTATRLKEIDSPRSPELLKKVKCILTR